MAGRKPQQLTALSQRAEYTARQNQYWGRHGWLRFTPAYSVALVNELIGRDQDQLTYLDPFGGTGTTALVAATRGQRAISLEINPFLVWLSRAKFATYSADDVAEALYIQQRIQAGLSRARAPMADRPPLRYIERWWEEEDIDYLQKIKGGIKASGCGPRACNLLLVAFCRVLIERAKLSRSHQSLSFATKNNEPQFGLSFDDDPFALAIRKVIAAALDNPKGRATARLSDARQLSGVRPESIDVVLTSPPYPNRVSFVRELRPYMYWLDFLDTGKGASDLDWKAIGGTWGTATDRLADWCLPSSAEIPSVVRAVAGRIAKKSEPTARLMSAYVLRYFSDFWEHITALKRAIKPEGVFHYVVGNASFYGELVETEKALVKMFQEAEFGDVRARVLRKRNSKAELFEFVVQGRGK